MKYLYFILPVLVGAITLALEMICDGNGPLVAEGETMVSAMYYAGIIVVAFCLFTLWAVFRGFRQNGILKISLLAVSSLLVIVEHYAFYDTNYLYFVAIMAVAYLMQWKSCVR